MSKSVLFGNDAIQQFKILDGPNGSLTVPQSAPVISLIFVNGVSTTIAGATITQAVDQLSNPIDGLYNVTIPTTGLSVGDEIDVHISCLINLTTKTSCQNFSIIEGVNTVLDNYPDGKLWFDFTNGTPGNVLGVNGTIDNPISDIADAAELARNYGLTIFIVDGALPILSNVDFTNVKIEGRGLSTLVNIISNCTFTRTRISNCSVSVFPGFFTTGTSIEFERCSLSLGTYFKLAGEVYARDCIIQFAEISALFAFDVQIASLEVAGPSFIHGGGNSQAAQIKATTSSAKLVVTDYHGNIEILESEGEYNSEYSFIGGSGQIEVDPVTGARTYDLAVSGRNKNAIVDNSGGAVTLSVSDERGVEAQAVRDAMQLPGTDGGGVNTRPSIDAQLDEANENNKCEQG